MFGDVPQSPSILPKQSFLGQSRPNFQLSSFLFASSTLECKKKSAHVPKAERHEDMNFDLPDGMLGSSDASTGNHLLKRSKVLLAGFLFYFPILNLRFSLQ